MHESDASIEEQLRASRARLLASADTERREIERALHDGIQQELVALAVKLQLARRLEDSDPAGAQNLLVELGGDIKESLDGVRALAELVYPSALATRGLAEALRGTAAMTGSSIRIDVEKLGRYPPDLEAAVYFCCRNVLESAASVRLWEEDGALNFVCNVGAAGVDFAHLRDRVETLGGTLTTMPDSAGGTRIAAAIPLPQARPRREREERP